MPSIGFHTVSRPSAAAFDVSRVGRVRDLLGDALQLHEAAPTTASGAIVSSGLAAACVVAASLVAALLDELVVVTAARAERDAHRDHRRNEREPSSKCAHPVVLPALRTAGPSRC